MSPACAMHEEDSRVRQREEEIETLARRPPSAENHHPLKLNFERYTLGTWIQLAIANGVKLAIRTNLSFLCPPPCISPHRFYVFSCAVPRDRAKFPPRMEKFDRCNGRKWKVNEVFTCAGSTGRGIAICRESAFTSSLVRFHSQE